MTHSFIQENDVRDRYVTGRLSLEERSTFEEHLSDCPECLDEVEMLERFRRGLRTVVVEEAARDVVVQSGIWAFLKRGGRLLKTARLAGLALVILIPATLVYFLSAKPARQRLDRIQRAYSDLQSQYSQQQEFNENLKEQLRISEENRSATATDHGGPTAPGGRIGLAASMPLFSLNRVRGMDQGSPANEVVLRPSSPWLILLLEIEPDPTVQSYRAMIVHDRGRPIWNAQNLQVSHDDTIAIIVSSNLLNPGDYALNLEACDKGGCRASARYSFRVTALR